MDAHSPDAIRTRSMRRLLVINPNTSASVSTLLQQHVQAQAGAQVQVRTVTARFGAPYIADEASYAVAGHAVLDAWAAALAAAPDGPPDAVLIGCFGDPGLLALRESSPVPVTALAEAAFIEAARHGRFAIVTGGAKWGPMLQRLAQALGHAPALAGIHTVAPTGAQLAADPAAARTLLAQACRDAVQQLGAQAVIVGGAGLAGMAAALQPDVGVPLIDSVAAGARWALRGDAAAAERAAPGFDVPWDNMSPDMGALSLRA
jgi:Asp/Glu/hydantoin racemase